MERRSYGMILLRKAYWMYKMAIRKSQSNSRHSAHAIASSKDIARIYKRFFERFQAEYNIFLTYIHGITDNADLNKYASLMLTRLIFLYFLQHKNFLDNDPNYLSNHLKIFQNGGDTTDLNFYHDFLLRVLFNGLSNLNHSSDLCAITGNIPFLNIDLFKENQIESNNSFIQISNEAFEGILTFFDTYYWQLDDQSSPSDNVITPDIFVYILEKHINRKQMGAYYTQGDITEYIAKSTIIPFLFNAVETKYPGPIQSNGLVWQLLKDNPDRYIYSAIKKGVELALPSEIEEGLYEVSKRNNWNRLAMDAYALPTETWREVIARRQHYQQIHIKLESDTPLGIDDLVVYNLDICQFARDVIERCEDHELLQAIYESILKLSVLDPTCGAGSFLFAALDIIEPLYSACLNRLEQMKSIDSPCWCQLRRSISKPSNRQYSTIKSIITSNLYGVEIMDEATEICKLRLFLKLLAEVRHTEEIEPLPNLDGNIRTGNVLMGSIDQLDDPKYSGGAYSHQEPCSSHEDQPFHWFVEFNTVMQNGGFDVVIGNPPYVEFKKVSNLYKFTNFTTSVTGNLYALIMERCASLLAPGGRFGMIVPASATCTDGYLPLQQILLEQSSLYIASFSDQRGKLFDISHPRLCIISYQKRPGLNRVFTTPYIKPEWKLRKFLFQRLEFIEVTQQIRTGIIPRYRSPIEQSLHAKLYNQSRHLGDYLYKTGTHKVFFTRKLSWFVQVTPFIPRIIDAQGRIRKPSELKMLLFSSQERADIAFVALNSNLFYWFLTTGSDCRNLNMREVLGLPFNIDEIPPSIRKDLLKLASLLTKELQVHSEMRRMNFKDTGELTIQCIFPGKSKPIIDEIDQVLAQHYGFTDEELDFIINYDVKYRRRKS